MGRRPNPRRNRPWMGRLGGGNAKNRKAGFRKGRQANEKNNWIHWIQKWKTSGLTQAQFCRQHGLQPSYFSFQKTKSQYASKPLTRSGELKATLSKNFIPLPVELGAQLAPFCEIAFPDGKIIRFNNRPPSKFLRHLLFSKKEG